MAQLNISVPDELKERMDALQGEGERVIWSRIAARAFDLEVKSRTLKGTDMKSAIARLHASRAKVLESDRLTGIECGKTWAIQHAEWDELRDVAALDEDGWCEDGAGHGLWNLLREHDYDEAMMVEAFDRKRGEDVSDEAASGFIEGARLVFEEAENAPEEPDAA